MKSPGASRVLFLIILLGFAVRFAGLTRDGLNGFHPDEQLMAGGVMAIRLPEQLNPGFFDYNGFPLYLVRMIAVARARLGAGEDAVKLGGVLAAGRVASATFSAMSVPLVYVLGSQFLGPLWALPAAVLFAVDPLSVQQAHFFTTESFFVFFFLAMLVLLVNWRRTHSRGVLILAAICAGIGIGSKTTFILTVPIPLALILAADLPRARKVRFLAVFCAVAVVTFTAVSPLAITDLPKFLERTGYLEEMVSGRQQYDWTIQFTGTTPAFLLKNLVYAAGPFQMAAGSLGLVYFAVDGLRKKRYAPAVIGVWGLAFLLYLSAQYAKYIRYTLPLLPLLALGGIYLVKRVWQKRNRIVAVFLIAAAVADIGWGLAVASLYGREHPYLPLSRYMIASMPAGSRIVYEMWNCLCYPVGDTQMYLSWLNFNFYDPDTPQKTASLADALAGYDYFIITSDKVYRTVNRLSGRYPESNGFYRLLFSGKLGYRQVWEYSQYPALGPLVFDDSGSEETFRVFDHPHIYVFRNTGRLSPEAIRRLLSSP